jgi:mannan endo-1,4-beta-mannosidase
MASALLGACSPPPSTDDAESALSAAGPIVSAIANKCLDDHGGATTDGSKIELWDCNGSEAQRWSFTNGTIVGPGGKCLDIQADHQVSGTIVQLYDCNGTNAQKWTRKGAQIESTAGLCLDVSGSQSADGTQVQVWTCNGTNAQKWTPEATTSTPDRAAPAKVDMAEPARVDMAEPPTTGTGGGSTARPAYNTGNGVFVAGGKLYDPNGKEFRIRGVDRCHYDSDSQPGISHSGANAVRVFMYETSVGAALYAGVAKNQHIAYQEAPIMTMPQFPDGTSSSCNESTTELAAGVDWWVQNAATFTALDKQLIVNIANEWGPRGSTAWRDSYISAVQKMRAAGYLGPLMIDSGGCGQDQPDLLDYAQAVFAADPQKNLIFSFHLYGGMASATAMSTYFAQLAALSKSDGMVFVIGEFGPGRNIGPSPTLITPAQVITAAEANGIGWLAWAWDDNNLGNAKADDNWFSMTYSVGVYDADTDLTEFGKDVVLNATYGLKALAKPATW